MKHIYCDGACCPNPGQMGIGIVIQGHESGMPPEKWSRYLGQGTNQIAELWALIEAFKLADNGDMIYTDSQYAIGMAGNWKARKNFELVMELRKEKSRKKSVMLVWVKGHAGDVLQELADNLANQAATNGTGIDQPSHSDGDSQPCASEGLGADARSRRNPPF